MQTGKMQHKQDKISPQNIPHMGDAKTLRKVYTLHEVDWNKGKRAMAKILLVEDDDMNRDMLMRWLSRKGYEIAVAVDGLGALEKVAEKTPNLILMDLSLPDMDGWEATRRLKADNTTQHIPVIVLTAHALKTDREGAFEAGCDDYDVKPIDFPRLLEKIERLLETGIKKVS